MTKQSRPDLDSKTPEIKTEKRKAVGGDCKESTSKKKVRGNTAEDGISL